MNKIKADVVEIFLSIQGEGIYIGYPQLFIRFANCNLNCYYCDTLIKNTKTGKLYKSQDNYQIFQNPMSIEKLYEFIGCFENNYYHSIALTGGEPLLAINFLREFLSHIKNKNIFLETNGTLPAALLEIIDFVDIISMDFKFNSVVRQSIDYSVYKEFINIALEKNLYIKIVVSDDLSDDDLKIFLEFGIPNYIPIVIQPITTKENKIKVSAKKIIKIQQLLMQKFSDCRIIPQTHKFLELL